MIYHITTADWWAQPENQTLYKSPTLAEEGFIHCSEESQVAGVLERYFAGQQNLVRLSIDTDRLESPLRYEEAPSIGQVFPHIYGVINLTAVQDAEIIR